MSANLLAAIGAITAATPSEAIASANVMAAAPQGNVSFSQIFFDGVDTVSQKAAEADATVKAFILDDSVPTHRVMYALEQSQLSLQMMLQVRNRLVEGFQEIMRMQL